MQLKLILSFFAACTAVAAVLVENSVRGKPWRRTCCWLLECRHYADYFDCCHQTSTLGQLLHRERFICSAVTTATTLEMTEITTVVMMAMMVTMVTTAMMAIMEMTEMTTKGRGVMDTWATSQI